MRKPLLIGNWKSNGTQSSSQALAQSLKSAFVAPLGVDVVVCPPLVHLPIVRDALEGAPIAIGAQTVSPFVEGAYTGAVTASMLRDVGCHFVLVGHSERRTLMGETTSHVIDMAMHCVDAGLTPVVCVGETLQQRESGQIETIITNQLQELLAKAFDSGMLSDLVIAYEPIWAIGTGLQATPDQAQAVHAIIRSLISEIDGQVASQIRLLYGGSVSPSTAAGLLSMPDVDGALVGGASLRANDFFEIGEQCNQSCY